MKRMHVCGVGIAVMGLAVALGCGRMSKDSSKVVASVGGEKITEKTFAEMVKIVVPEEAKAKELLTGEAMKAQRNEFLGRMAKTKALLAYGKAEGLEKDPAMQLRLEQVLAQTYIQTLMEKRLAKAQPTEADLKATYDELVAERKAQGQTEGIPPYEQVKGQMPMIHKQRMEQKVFDQVMKEATDKTPITYADDYKPAQM